MRFLKHKSYTTAILKMSEDVRQKIDESKVTLLTLLGFSKAFDSTNLELLCTKIRTVQFHVKFVPMSPGRLIRHFYLSLRESDKAQF